MAADDLTASRALGDVVARERVGRGVSQEVLAEIVGCSRQYIAQLESGRRRRPSPRIVTSLANALQLRGEARQVLFRSAGLYHLSERPDNWPDLLRLAQDVICHEEYPAYVHDSMWRIWKWNRPAETLFEVAGGTIESGQTTLLDFIFDPVYRSHFVAWEHWLPAVFSEFLRDSRGVIHLRENRETLTRLRRHPDFRRYWKDIEAAPDSASSLKMVFRTSHGPNLPFRVVRLLYPGPADLWINVVVPARNELANF